MQITQDQFDKICYHLNDIMGLMGFGEEYLKIGKLIVSMAENGALFDVEKYYHIKRFLKFYYSK